jgi:hypothetical protein
MTQDWPMPRRSDSCAGCSVAFEIGAAIRARLLESPDGYRRLDYCLSCPGQTDAAVLAEWTTRRPEPASRKTPAFDREAVWAFFQRMSDPQTPQEKQFKFVLGLLLWRKRALKFENSTTQDGVEQWHFRVPVSGEHVSLERPDLDEAEIERLSAQVESLLAGTTDAPEAITPEPRHA